MRALCEHYRLSDDDTDIACAIVGGRIDANGCRIILGDDRMYCDDTRAVLTLLDRILEMHGIEPVPSDYSDDAYPPDLHLNAGDIYACTVIAEYDGWSGYDLHLCDLGTYWEEKQNDED